jgi:iron complex transport system substrate-binding protein
MTRNANTAIGMIRREFVAVGLAVAVMLFAVGCGQREPARPRADGPPQRIASLTLGSDELLAELVPPSRVVCVTVFADDATISNVAGIYPASAARVRDVDAERIVALTPDLVCVAPYNSADLLAVIERSGVSVFRNEAVNRIDEIEAGIVALGDRLGEPERAQALVDRMRARRQRVAERLSGESKRPRILYWSAGFTSGSETTIDDVIREAGGTNVARELGLSGSSEISPERVLAANPDYVLTSRWTGDDEADQITAHPLLRNLPAVQNGRVINIDGKYLTCVSQFIVEGVEQLAKALHPERFEAAARGDDSAQREERPAESAAPARSP